MRGLGVVLAAFLLLFSLCNVLAENSGLAEKQGVQQPSGDKARVTTSSTGESPDPSSDKTRAQKLVPPLAPKASDVHGALSLRKRDRSASRGQGVVDSVGPLAAKPHASYPVLMALSPVYRNRLYGHPALPAPSTLGNNPLHTSLPSSRFLSSRRAALAGLEVGDNDSQRDSASRDEGRASRDEGSAAHRVKRGGYSAPYFVGKRDAEEEELGYVDVARRAGPMFVGKRASPMFVGKRMSPMVVGQRSPMFVGKRSPMFVGKKASPMFVGKRANPMFVGRRASPMFVGKKASPMFVGKKAANPMFVGRRANPMFVGKKASPMFVGKRANPMFVGKRANPMFLGKKASPMFVGKRASPMFVGKRETTPMLASKKASPMFVGRRAGPMFVGRRAGPMFVGRRAGPMFVGRRAGPMFVGKRARPMFVGKRENEGIGNLLAALKRLQAARHYRRMIQTDKRHNAPYFVGRRSQPSAIEDSSPRHFDPSQEIEKLLREEQKQNSADQRINSPASQLLVYDQDIYSHPSKHEPDNEQGKTVLSDKQQDNLDSRDEESAYWYDPKKDVTFT